MTHEQILARLFAQWSRTGTLTYDDMMVAHEQMVLLKDQRKWDPRTMAIVNTTNPNDMLKKRRPFEDPESLPEDTPKKKNIFLYLCLIGISVLSSTIAMQFVRAKQANLDPAAMITPALGIIILIGLISSMIGTIGLYYQRRPE